MLKSNSNAKGLYREVGDQNAKECKRRNILHFYDTHTEYIVDGYPLDRYKVKIKETRLKVQQLVEWTLTKYNTDTIYEVC